VSLDHKNVFAKWHVKYKSVQRFMQGHECDKEQTTDKPTDE